jgi:hypothetical protein
MPEIPEIKVPQIKEIPPPANLPTAPSITLELGPPVVHMPGCVAVHPDAKLNPSLLEDDPSRVSMYCPDGQIPHFNPLDYTPSQYVPIKKQLPKGGDDSEKDESTPAQLPTVPQLPKSNAPTPKGTEIQAVPKPLLKKVVDGLPPVEAVVTTTTIALVASTAALVARPLSEVVLKTIKPTVKKLVKTAATIRGKTVVPESVWERRLAQRDRNRALRALRRALKP